MQTRRNNRVMANATDQQVRQGTQSFVRVFSFLGDLEWHFAVDPANAIKNTVTQEPKEHGYRGSTQIAGDP